MDSEVNSTVKTSGRRRVIPKSFLDENSEGENTAEIGWPLREQPHPRDDQPPTKVADNAIRRHLPTSAERRGQQNSVEQQIEELVQELDVSLVTRDKPSLNKETSSSLSRSRSRYRKSATTERPSTADAPPMPHMTSSHSDHIPSLVKENSQNSRLHSHTSKDALNDQGDNTDYSRKFLSSSDSNNSAQSNDFNRQENDVTTQNFRPNGSVHLVTKVCSTPTLNICLY